MAAAQTLVSVSTIGTQSQMSEAELAEAVRQELGGWFGVDQVASWKLLRSYRIPFAQPNQVRSHHGGDQRPLESL